MLCQLLCIAFDHVCLKEIVGDMLMNKQIKSGRDQLGPKESIDVASS